MDIIYKQIVNSMIVQKNTNNCQAVFVKGGADGGIEEEFVRNAISENQEVHLLYYRYSYDSIQPAFNPFLEWIRLLYNKYYVNEYSVHDFVRLCAGYCVYDPVLISYIETKKCHNNEDIAVYSYNTSYNEKDIVISIKKIIKYILNEHKLFIVLDRLQYAHDSTLRLIISLLTDDNVCGLYILASFDTVYNPYKYVKQEWEELHHVLEKKSLLIEHGTRSVISEDYRENKNIAFSSENIKSLLFVTKNCYELISFKQAEYYLEIMYKQIIYNNVIISEEDKLLVIILYALVSMCLKNFKYTLMLCEKISESLEKTDNIYGYAYNFISAISQKRLFKDDKAKYHVRECSKIAEAMNDDFFIFRARLLDFQIRGWIGDTSDLEGMKSISPEQVKEERVLEFCNEVKNRGLLVSYVYMVAFYLESDEATLTAINNNKRDFIYFYDAVEVAKKLNNQIVLENAFYMKYYLAYRMGLVHLDDTMRRKNIEVQQELNMTLSLYTYAMMGYYCSTREQYEESHKSNNELLIRMYDIQKSINNESGITNSVLELLRVLYNMATNCMCAGDFESASKFLLAVVNELEDMYYADLFVCNTSKLYGMIAYCFYVRKMVYNASAYLEKEHMLILNVANDGYNKREREDALFFYHLVNGLIKKSEGQIDEAIININLSFEWMKTEKGQLFVLYPLFAVAKYEILMEAGRVRDAKDAIYTCCEYCESNKLYEKKQILLNIIDKGIEEGFYNISSMIDFGLHDISLESISLLLRNKRTEAELIEKSKDADYLLMWQENLNNINVEATTMVNNVMPLLKKYFNLDNLFLIRKEDGILLYEDSDWNLSKESVNEIVGCFNEINNPFLVRRTERDYFAYDRIMKALSADNIVTLIGMPVIKEQKTDKIFIAFTTMKDKWIENEAIIKDYRLDTIKLAVNQLVNAEKIINSIELVNAANKAKSAFLANISHEIRTPINAVLGMDEMILRECSIASIVEYAQNIKNAGKTLLSIINDVLDFSKIESGNMEIIPTQYDSVDMIRNIINMVDKKAEEKFLKFNVNVDKQLPKRLYGDEIRVKQVVMNILTNAIKYTKEGSVTLRVKGNILDEKNIFLILEVEDTGIGIKEQDLIHLFTYFKRIEEEKNRNIEGTGLGMSIVKQLLGMMDGQIDVKSEYGVGSVFTITIPQKIVDSSPILNFSDMVKSYVQDITKYKESFIAPTACILAVDDSEVNLSVVKGLLKSTQISVDTAISGQECLRMVRKKKYDIIFMDHMMPNMDGVETLFAMKKINHMCKETPVIALTANAIMGAKNMYLDAGFVDYISKPIDAETFEKTVRDYLPKDKVEIKHNESIKHFNGNTEIRHIPDYLSDIFRYVDVELGLKYNGYDLDGYIDVVKSYIKSGKKICCILQEDIEIGNIKDYAINVHSLKSTSLTIGVKELYSVAKQLEEEANKENIVFIQNEHNKIKELFINVERELDIIIERYTNNVKKKKKTEISKEEFLDKIHELRDYLEKYMLINAQDIINNLIECSYNDNQIYDSLDKIKDCIEEFEIDIAIEVADILIKKITIML